MADVGSKRKRLTRKGVAAWRAIPVAVRRNLLRELRDEAAHHAAIARECDTAEQRAFWRVEVAGYKAAIAVLREAARG